MENLITKVIFFPDKHAYMFLLYRFYKKSFTSCAKLDDEHRFDKNSLNFYQIVYDFVIFCQNSHVYFFLMKLTLRGEFKSNYMYRGKKKYLLSRGMEV